jgi:hypothetical protein
MYAIMTLIAFAVHAAPVSGSTCGAPRALIQGSGEVRVCEMVPMHRSHVKGSH